MENVYKIDAADVYDIVREKYDESDIVKKATAGLVHEARSGMCMFDIDNHTIYTRSLTDSEEVRGCKDVLLYKIEANILANECFADDDWLTEDEIVDWQQRYPDMSKFDYVVECTDDDVNERLEQILIHYFDWDAVAETIRGQFSAEEKAMYKEVVELWFWKNGSGYQNKETYAENIIEIAELPKDADDIDWDWYETGEENPEEDGEDVLIVIEYYHDWQEPGDDTPVRTIKRWESEIWRSRNRIAAETIEVISDFPNDGESYCIVKDGNRYAFVWGWKYPDDGEVPAGDVDYGENGLKWFPTKQEARAAMEEAILGWADENPERAKAALEKLSE